MVELIAVLVNTGYFVSAVQNLETLDLQTGDLLRLLLLLFKQTSFQDEGG